MIKFKKNLFYIIFNTWLTCTLRESPNLVSFILTSPSKTLPTSALIIFVSLSPTLGPLTLASANKPSYLIYISDIRFISRAYI